MTQEQHDQWRERRAEIERKLDAARAEVERLEDELREHDNWEPDGCLEAKERDL